MARPAQGNLPYAGAYPTAYHPHGDYSLQAPRARDAGAGANAPAVSALDVPGTESPNKPEVLMHEEKINVGHGSSNTLVAGED